MSVRAIQTPTGKVGTLKACYRLMKDPNTKKVDKIIMSAWWLYLLSPVDVVPEALLGPGGLADDAGIGARAAYLVFVAYKYYRQPREL